MVCILIEDYLSDFVHFFLLINEYYCLKLIRRHIKKVKEESLSKNITLICLFNVALKTQ